MLCVTWHHAHTLVTADRETVLVKVDYPSPFPRGRGRGSSEYQARAARVYSQGGLRRDLRAGAGGQRPTAEPVPARASSREAA